MSTIPTTLFVNGTGPAPRRSIQLDPKNGTVYVNRGLAQCQADMFEPMCDSFKKACELNDCTGLEWAKSEGYCQ